MEDLFEKVERRDKVKYDVVVIGSGIGGYPAAIYLANKGFKTAIVEEHMIGGECTNYGCVPTKALYHIAEAMRAVSKVNGKIEYDWANLATWVKNIVTASREGIQYLLEKNNVEIYMGKALLKTRRTLKISEEGREIEADKLILALGTDPVDLPNVRFDGKGVLSNREVVYLDEKPGSMLIIGGGVVGVEMANVFSSLGVDITVVEISDHILPFADKDVATALRSYLVEKGIKIYEGTSVMRIDKVNGKYIAHLSSGKEVCIDKVLVAIGRKPKTSGIGLVEAGIELDNKGFIKVNETYEAVPGIYAVGDVIGGQLLAHKALLESISVARAISGDGFFRVNYDAMPVTIFTGLEIALIGSTEKQLRERGIKYIKVKLPIYHLASVKIKGSRHSFVKVLMDSDKGEKIYGLQIVAPNASEIVSSYLPLYLGKISIEETMKLPYPHLTVSESLRELAEYIMGESIHIILKR
ncbi:MAG: dihydrolipoyl dehydrogenase [Desulfurococcaceae archaeon]